MKFYDDELRNLQQKIQRRSYLDSKLTELHRREKELAPTVGQLHAAKINEQSDVDRLEGRSLSAFFFKVAGKIDEKLDKERQEAYAAAVKYDVASRELESVRADIVNFSSERRTLDGSEDEYYRLLAEKAEAVKASGVAGATEIFGAEEELASFDAKEKELREAVNEGERALQIIKKINAQLNEAEDWGTLDLFGGGLISDLAKHGALDEAQELVEQLQVQLGRFKTELSDVEINADIQIKIEGFTRFADYFFDGIFTDWTVLGKIKDAMSRVEETNAQVTEITDSLKSMLSVLSTEKAKVKNRIDELVLNTKL